ncbi:MAG TPA: TonB-dependent receptor [Pyrinomonadaceae bacterium]|nr:TonB-dependent receptor [Pyrinomonadaceae bacterium]
MRQKALGAIRHSAIAILLLCLATIIASGQFRGAIQGVVTDNLGGTVAGAKVTLKDNSTGQTRTTVTTEEGFYRFAGLAPGEYTITAEKDNFKKKVVNNVRVEAESLQGENITLEAGVISETVTVQAEGLSLQTEDPNVRGTISNEQILDLPKPGRDPYELARLAPGVFGAGARGANGASVGFPNTSGPGGSNLSIFQTENVVPITANGQRVSSNNYQIDGISVNSQTWGGGAVITPSAESVKEVQVTSSTYSAEDGRNSGVQLKVVTQSGSNTWHGSAFFKLNDPSLNAFNTMPLNIGSVTTQGPQRVERKYKSYGGSLGGRIIRDKLFFFFSYEGLTEKTNNTRNTFVETQQLRQTIISARPNTIVSEILSSSGIQPRVIQVLTPTCSGIFSSCAVVGNGIDVGSITGSYGTYVPTFSTNPNGGGLDGIADLQFVQLALPASNRGNQYFTRIDYNATPKDSFAFSAYFTPVNLTSPDSSAQSRPMADIISKRLNYAFAVIYNRSFSSRLLNEARFNITRWGYNELDSNPDSRFDLPRIEIEGIFSDRLRFGSPWGLNTPGDITERQLDFRDIVRYVAGNHALSFGGEYRVDLNDNFEIGGARPLYSFHRIWNFANGTPIFETLTANPQGKPTANNTSFKTGDLAFFIQDNWKARPNLTLNLGLRWEYFSPITARGNGVLGNIQLGPTGGISGAKIVTDKQLTDRDLNNFGPQLGFAWSPKMFDNKLVIRGGAGIGFDRLPNALLANARRNPPNGSIYGICCGTASGEFGSPFVGGLITFIKSADGTILGYPANPALGGGTNPSTGLPNSGSIEIYGSQRDLPNAEVYRYSLEGQYELPWQMIASLGYQGSLGRHFVRIDRVHITVPGSNPNIFAAYVARPDVNTSFNALLASLRGRLRYGFNFIVNYRFSKSLDTVSFEAPCACTDQSFPVDQKEEHGPSDFDVRHTTTASFIWDIPFFNNKSDWKGKLLGGWQISSIITQHTGYPWTPKLFGCLNIASAAGFCDPRPTSYNGQRPSSNSNSNFLRPNGIFGVPGTSVFGTSFSSSDPFANRPAIGRNALFGPKYFATDVSVSKRFGLPNVGFLNESAAIDVRFNFFNVFNNLNLVPFNSNTDPTRVQLPTFGIATGGLSGRVGEFQIRFSF